MNGPVKRQPAAQQREGAQAVGKRMEDERGVRENEFLDEEVGRKYVTPPHIGATEDGPARQCRD